jgi:hypothetical protein
MEDITCDGTSVDVGDNVTGDSHFCIHVTWFSLLLSRLAVQTGRYWLTFRVRVAL